MPFDQETNAGLGTETNVGTPESSVTNETTPAYANPYANEENGSQASVEAVEENVPYSGDNALENDGSAYKVQIDENGKRSVVLVPANEVEQQQPQDNGEQVQGGRLTDSLNQNTDSASGLYNLDEFSQAIASGNVDEGRVPEEFKSQYTDYKINQAMKAYNQQVQEAAEQKAQIEQQLTPEQKQTQMRDFLKNLDEEAAKKAQEVVGLSDEEVDDLEYLDDDDDRRVAYEQAKSWYRQELGQELQKMAASKEAERQAQQAVYGDIREFVQEQQKKEPNFHAIDVMMETRFQTLPFNEGKRVEAILGALKSGNITQQQTEELRNYYEATRKEYYANKAGLSSRGPQASRPPIVERPGNGAPTGSNYQPNYKALRTASVRERQAWMIDYLNNRR